MRLFRISLLASTLLFCAQAASAEDISSCTPTLIKDTYKGQYSIDEQMALAYSIDESNYDQAKEAFSATGQAIIYGIPVNNTMNYDKFSEARRKRFEDYNFSYSKKEAQTWSIVHFSKIAATSYSDCLKNLKSVGSHIYVQPSVQSNIPSGISDSTALRVVFNTAADDKHFRTITFKTSYGFIDGDRRVLAHLRKFKGSIDEYVQLLRPDNSVEAKVSISTADNNAADAVVIPPVIKIRKAEPKFYNIIKDDDLSGDNPNQQILGNKCYPETAAEMTEMKNSKIVPASAKVVVSYCSPRGDCPIAPPYATYPSDKQVCWVYKIGIGSVNAGGASGHGGHFHLTAVRESKEWRDLSPTNKTAAARNIPAPPKAPKGKAP